MTIFVTDNTTHNIDDGSDKRVILDMSTDDFMGEGVPIDDVNVVKINLDAEVFYTSKNTLAKSTYFSDLLLLSDDAEFDLHGLDIEGFKHVLKWMRNPYYVIPDEYYDAAVFFGCVGDNMNSFMNFNDVVNCGYKATESGESDINIMDKKSRRHTNFIANNNMVRLDNSDHGLYILNVDRYCDLFSGAYLVLVPEYDWEIADIGDIDTVTLEIGGGIQSFKTGAAILIDLEINMPKFYPIYLLYKEKNILYIPLNFALLKRYLPLLALHYHQVKLIIKTTNRIKYRVNIGYQSIFLDRDELRRFAQVSHEYLVNDFNAKTFDTVPNNTFIFALDIVVISALIIKLSVPTSLRAIIFNNNKPVFYTDRETSLTDFHKLKYKNVPDTYYIIPFCIKNPNEFQPSGSRNLLGDIQLHLYFDTTYTGTITIGYYIYNVTRIMSGMLGNAYTHEPIIRLIS